jgi:hypothetical protein
MEQSAYLNLQNFNIEARKELKSFIEFLVYKYNIGTTKNMDTDAGKKQFTAISIDTKGFKFNRDEANER